MNDERSFERDFADAVAAERGSGQLPDSFYDDFRQRASHVRQRPRWLALMKEPPMRLSSGIAVGSPMVRVAAIMVATLLISLMVAGAGIAGSRLLAAGPIIVAQDGSGTVTTITEAIAMAEDGDTVLVKPGTYPESVVITADITLRGNGDPGAVVLEFADDGATRLLDEDPGYSTPGAGDPVAYGILLDHSDAHVENITLRGRIAGSEIMVGAVVIDGGAPVIEGIDVLLDGEPYPDHGWYVQRSAFHITGGSSVVIRASSWDGFTRLFGLASSPTFEGNTITTQRVSIRSGGHRPTFRGNTLLDGAEILFAEPGGSAIIEDNDIVGSIGGESGDGTTIRNNRIRGGGEPADGGSAIGIEGSGTIIVEDNEITDSPYGIDVTGPGATLQISGNTIRGSVSAAIVVQRDTAPTIDGNTIEGNATGIAVRGDTTTPVITGNAFCGNETDLMVPVGSTLTLDGNTICEAEASDAP